jgi:hypothetical protein
MKNHYYQTLVLQVVYSSESRKVKINDILGNLKAQMKMVACLTAHTSTIQNTVRESQLRVAQRRALKIGSITENIRKKVQETCLHRLSYSSRTFGLLQRTALASATASLIASSTSTTVSGICTVSKSPGMDSNN